VSNLLRRVWAHRWWIFIPAVVGFAVSVGFALVEEDVYEVEAVLLSEFTSTTGGSVRNSEVSRTREMLNSARERVFQYDKLVRWIRSYELYPSLGDDIEKQYRKMSKDLGLSRGGRSGAVRIKMRYSEGENPSETAATVVNAIADDLFKSTRDSVSKDTMIYRDFYGEEAATHLENVERARKALMAFRLDHEGSLPEDRATNKREIARLRSNIQAIAMSRVSHRLELKVLERELEQANKQLLDARIAAGADPELAPRTKELAELRELLVQAERTWTPGSTEMKKLRADIDRLQKQVVKLRDEGAESADASDPMVGYATKVVQGLEDRKARVLNDIAGTDELIKTNETQIAEAEARIVGSREIEIEYLTLQRDLGRAQSLASGLQAKSDRAELDLKFQKEQKDFALTVHQRAIPTTVPVAPDRMKLSLVGLFLGLALGGGVTFLRIRMDKSVRTRECIQDLLPNAVFVTIPEVSSGGVRLTRVFGQLVLAATLLIVAGVALGALGIREGWWGDPTMFETITDRVQQLTSSRS